MSWWTFSEPSFGLARGNQAESVRSLFFGEVRLLIARRETSLLGQDPYLKDSCRRFRVVELAVSDSAAGRHVLHVSGIKDSPPPVLSLCASSPSRT